MFSRLYYCTVLILVLVEDGLRERNKYLLNLRVQVVLILVLVEDGFRVKYDFVVNDRLGLES